MAEEQETDLEYKHRQQMNYGSTMQSQWQVDPRDIRLFVEDSLKGKRTITTTRYLYHILHSEDPNTVIASFYSETDEEAEQGMTELLVKEKLNTLQHYLTRTDITETTTQTKAIKHALVNPTGAYHILAIIETIFSRIGYMSNLRQEEINDILWNDVLVPLVGTMMENHVAYGIKKGSRDEILGLMLSTTHLILKSSLEGWTGDRFAATIKETISTNSNPQNKKWGM